MFNLFVSYGARVNKQLNIEKIRKGKYEKEIKGKEVRNKEQARN